MAAFLGHITFIAAMLLTMSTAYAARRASASFQFHLMEWHGLAIPGCIGKAESATRHALHPRVRTAQSMPSCIAKRIQGRFALATRLASFLKDLDAGVGT